MKVVGSLGRVEDDTIDESDDPSRYEASFKVGLEW